MKRALIIGASGGIGAEVAHQLSAQGVDIVALSRSRDGFDLSDPDTVDTSLTAVEGVFDLIFVATGMLGSPEKSLSAVTADELKKIFAINAIGPALIMRHVPRLLRRDGRAVAAFLSARVGSIGDNKIGGWHSYRTSKAALNQLVRGCSIEVARSHKQAVVVALHPGTVATRFTERFATRHKTVPADVAAANLLKVIANLGPSDSGRFYDYAGEEVPW